MDSTEKKELLEEMLGIEDRLRDSFGWNLFSRGIAKEYHRVLENKNSSPQEIMRLFLRFLDERGNMIISVYKKIIETQLKEKDALEKEKDALERKRVDLSGQIESMTQENNMLREINNECKEDISKLEVRIDYYKSRINLLEGLPKKFTSEDLEKYVKEVEPEVAPCINMIWSEAPELLARNKGESGND